jgi:hypothetical protein
MINAFPGRFFADLNEKIALFSPDAPAEVPGGHGLTIRRGLIYYT